ncbi:MAG: site-2 protease family protein [Oscillatoriaceae bacterium SKW80]|nr:site-2 protease family protein [Oscillatoriaceae bacterium SKYG93]MCX8121790.1 site-2 protease family protein [Oscillatoriaceae bacterium SKW80]MDW8452555.1 site-2 protease family protein [Oscillatoriaceae cyanobacterium SKYGB_i_bin93]HIK28658.1 site-2 protease family protein [Oscillatoriaceae cyanobacterium M7585_C2015_266]
MNGSFRIGKLFNIPFYIHVSWFFILGLITFTYGKQLAVLTRLGGALPWLLGLITALLLFASVLAHELGHSLAAIRQGIEVKSITLFLFGGLATLDKESKTPAEAFWVALAGPLVSFLLFTIFTASATFIPLPIAAAIIVKLLASLNLALGLFNLIPGLPLDGGNILKAAVWKITGNPYKGIIFASRVGQLFGWLAIISGLIFGQFWNILIGWFLLQNAGYSAQNAAVQDKLAGLTAADAVTPDSPIVSEHLSLREFANDYVIGKKTWRKFLVTNEQGQLVGAIATDELKAIPTNLWAQTPVKQLTKPLQLPPSVTPERSLLEVATILEQKKLSELIVIGENGIVVGLIEKAGIIRLLQEKAQVNPA